MSPRARILFIGLMLVVAAGCVALGLWQRSRLLGRRAANATAAASRALPPVDLASAPDGPLADRHVVARGSYDGERQMLLRGQVLQGAPGVVVLAPLRRVRGDSAILVVRGFVPSSDGITPPQLDSVGPGEQVIEGIARAIPGRTGRGQLLEREGWFTWKELELEPLREALPYPLLGSVLFADSMPGAPAWPRRIGPPPLDDGPHLSYMLQWFGFASVALVMALLALRRRQASEWSEPTGGSSAAGAPPPPHSP